MFSVVQENCQTVDRMPAREFNWKLICESIYHIKLQFNDFRSPGKGETNKAQPQHNFACRTNNNQLKFGIETREKKKKKDKEGGGRSSKWKRTRKKVNPKDGQVDKMLRKSANVDKIDIRTDVCR